MLSSILTALLIRSPAGGNLQKSKELMSLAKSASNLQTQRARIRRLSIVTG